jgi:hypothetical protein
MIAATKYSPLISFTPAEQYLRIEGESWPENAMETYSPLIHKLKEYFSEPQQNLRIELLFEGLNTSSQKMMLEIFSQLQEYHAVGHQIELTWYYPQDDEELKEAWEMLLEDVQFPYKFIEQTY